MALACVTGATGYVANELIAQLLDKGYHVRATCRCEPSSAKLAALRSLAEASPGKLDLIQVDSILEPSPALSGAVSGVKYLFHVASPFRFDGDPITDVVEPAVKGTRTVLAAAAASQPPVTRVVVTSSVCAIHDQHQAQPPAADLYDEADWNNTSKVPEQAYWVSKVDAEKAAWEVAKEHGLDLVTILPNFVLGPLVNPACQGVSIGFMKGILENSGEPLKGSWTICDVRDVAAAHIAAAEQPGASGRYIVSVPGSIDARSITDTLKAKWPAAAALPDGVAGETKVTINNARVVGLLGRALRAPLDTVTDMAASLLSSGVAAPAWSSQQVPA